MDKHIQTICRLLPTNYLSVFDHFVRLALKGLTSSKKQAAKRGFLIILFLNWDSLHARLNSYKKQKHKKIKACGKSASKEPIVKRSLSILDLKPFKT